MRCAYGHSHIVACFGVDDGVIRCVETHSALRYEESLVVHFVPMRRRSSCPCWNCEFCASDAVVLICELGNESGPREDDVLPVRDPSSMILQVMWPSFKISPDFAGTKLMGLRGISILARACRASSSIVVMCEEFVDQMRICFARYD